MSNIIKASSVRMENVELFDYKNHQNTNKQNYTSEDSEIIEIVDADDDDLLMNGELGEEIRDRINEILNNAKLEAQQIKQAAETQGYNDGYNKGLSDAEAFKANLEMEYSNKFNTELENINNEKIEHINSMKINIADMIIQIAKKVITDKIEVDRELVINLVIAGLLKVTDVEQIVIKTSKEDYEIINNNKKQFENYVDKATKINIIKDEDIKKGDFIIETPFGVIDCGINTKIDSIQGQIIKLIS